MLKEPQVDSNVLWKQRYRLPATYGRQIAQLAPNRGLAVGNKSGIYQLYVWNVPTGELRQLTHRPEGVVRGTISPDGACVYYHDDRKGNEVGHTVRVPFEGGTPEDITADLPLYELAGFSFSHTGNRLGFTTITPAGFDVYCVDVGLNHTLDRRRKLYHSDVLTHGPDLSYNGEVAAITTADRPGTLRYSILTFDTAIGKQIGRLSDDDGSVELHVFSPLAGDMRLLGTTDKSGVKRPLLWNVRTGERIDITLDELEGEVEPVDWSPDGKQLLLRQFLRAIEQLYLYDLSTQSVKKLHHPSGSFGRVYFVPDGDIFAHLSDATHPSQLVVLDGKTGTQKQVLLSTGEVPPSHPWKSIIFISSDGANIQGWLGLPDGEGPFPAILETHGGPEAATVESFRPASQCWLDHGFAFLSINYHGSTTPSSLGRGL